MIFLTALILTLIPDPTQVEQNKIFWEQQLQNTSPDLRMTAVLKLRDLRFADTLSKIQPLLKDPDADVRFEVIRSVGKLSTTEALDVLKAALSEEKDPYLVSEMRRGIRSIEDTMKAADEAAKKATEAEAKKALKKSKGITEKRGSSSEKPSKSR